MNKTRRHKAKRRRRLARAVKWGIYDTVDHVWMGTDEGPKLFDSADPTFGVHANLLAQAAAMMTSVQLGWGSARCRARIFTGGALHLKDEVEAPLTPHEALMRIERGTV